MKYDCLIVDMVNLCHKIFKKKDEVISIGAKLVFKDSICEVIKLLENLSKKYLHDDGEVFLLFDNYYSRADLKTSFLFADRRDLSKAYKESRKKENKEFYNSVNFLKYFYTTGPSKYYTLQITGLEADDLVKPLLISKYGKNKTGLMITSDLDWCRYLSEDPKIDYLPDLGENPKTYFDMSCILGFDIQENNVILYKALFGDRSDDIKGIAPLNEENKKHFLELLGTFKDPLDLVFISRKMKNEKINPLLKIILDNEKQYSVNVQLISSIPCDPTYVEGYIVKGGATNSLHKTIREAIGLDTQSKKFVFGNIKRPRAQEK